MEWIVGYTTEEAKERIEELSYWTHKPRLLDGTLIVKTYATQEEMLTIPGVTRCTAPQIFKLNEVGGKALW